MSHLKFKYEEIQLKDDYEGKVIATLITSENNKPNQKPVLYIHGFNDYFFHPHLTEELHKAGYNFYALELRKYGHSLLPHQHPNYCRDLHEYFEEISKALDIIHSENKSKVVLLGHSTGVLISAMYCNYGDNKHLIDALVLNSPFLDLNQNTLVKKIAIPLMGLIGKLFPWAYVTGGVSPFYAKSLHKDHYGEWDFNTDWKPIVSFPQYLSWLAAIRMAQDTLATKSALSIPVLVLVSNRFKNYNKWDPDLLKVDRVLKVDLIKNNGRKLGSNVTIIEIEDAVHDVFLSSEPVRNKAMKKMVNWLKNL